jgi:hypothetical protein
VAEKFAKQKIVESVAGRRQMIHGPLFLNVQGWLLNFKTKSAVNTVSQKANFSKHCKTVRAQIVIRTMMTLKLAWEIILHAP